MHHPAKSKTRDQWKNTRRIVGFFQHGRWDWSGFGTSRYARFADNVLIPHDRILTAEAMGKVVLDAPDGSRQILLPLLRVSLYQYVF